MMIDPVVWAQYINVTDAHTDRQTHSQMATANAAPTHRVGRQKVSRNKKPRCAPVHNDEFDFVVLTVFM